MKKLLVLVVLLLVLAITAWAKLTPVDMIVLKVYSSNVNSTPAAAEYLLLESNDFILLESGDKLILE